MVTTEQRLKPAVSSIFRAPFHLEAAPEEQPAAVKTSLLRSISPTTTTGALLLASSVLGVMCTQVILGMEL